MVRRFDLLLALYIFGVVTSELMGAKTFQLLQVHSFYLNASVAIFLMPLLVTITDVVVEVYGKKRARSMVFCGLVCAALLTLYAVLATHLPPSHRFMSKEAAYDTIFGASARIAVASLIAFTVSEFLDVLVFAKLREKMQNRALWLRNNGSNFVSQFADSLVFLTLAFYSLQHGLGSNISFIFSLLIPNWLLRCLLSVVETPLVYLGVGWLRNAKQETE